MHHQLNGHEFEQTLGEGEGQGSLACCSPWGCRELDMTKRLNNNNQLTENDKKKVVKKEKPYVERKLNDEWRYSD